MQAPVGDRHTLGLSGRARGEQRVDRVPGAQRHRTIRGGEGSRRSGRERVEIDGDEGLRNGGRGLGPARTCAGDDHRRRTGQRQLPADDLGRRLRVDRHVGSAGEHDPVDRDEHLDRPRNGNRDRHIRPDTLLEQSSCERVDQRPVLGMVVGAPARANGGAGRVAGERVRQRIRDRDDLPGTGVGVSRTDPSFDRLVLGRGHQLGVADRRTRVRGQGVEKADEPIGEQAHRFGVVQVGRIEHRALPVVAVVGDADGQVDARGEFVRFGRGHGQAAGLADRPPADRQRLRGQVGDGRLVEGEPHLREGRVGLGAQRVHPFDDRLEGDVRVREGLEIGAADVVEQLAEAGRGVDSGPEDQRVDEHPDHRVEDRLATTGDRRPDGDVLGRGQARQQHRERRMRDHERGQPAIAGQTRNTLRDLLRHTEFDACTAL